MSLSRLQMITVLRTETLEGVGVLGIPRTALSRQESRLAFIEVHVPHTRLIGVPSATGVFEEGVGELGIHSTVIRSIIYFNFVNTGKIEPRGSKYTHTKNGTLPISPC